MAQQAGVELYEPGVVLTVRYPTLPPSSNHIYFPHPKGGMRKTPEARAWQNRFIAQVGQDHLFSIKKIQDMAEIGMVFTFEVTLLLELKDIVNPGWVKRWTRDCKGGHKGQRKAETRYKKVDVTNRFKLIEDAMASALGIDDSTTFVATGKKLVCMRSPGVVVSTSVDDPRAFGIPDEYLGPP